MGTLPSADLGARSQLSSLGFMYANKCARTPAPLPQPAVVVGAGN